MRLEVEMDSTPRVPSRVNSVERGDAVFVGLLEASKKGRVLKETFEHASFRINNRNQMGQTHIDRLLMHRTVMIARSAWAMGSLAWPAWSAWSTRSTRSWPFCSFTIPRIDAIYSVT